jgi:hypothetical protein
MDNRRLVTRKTGRIPNKNTLKKQHVDAVFSMMFGRSNAKELQNSPLRSPALKLSGALSSRLRLGLQPPKRKKEPQSSFLSQNNVGLWSGPAFTTR